jgi:hypothetical protein
MRVLILAQYTTRPAGLEVIYTQNTLHTPYIDLSVMLVIPMRKHFSLGFGISLLVFLTINVLMAHLASDCGLLALFGRDGCADDIARAGWPLQFYEEGGFAYRYNFNTLSLMVDIAIGAIFSVTLGWLYSQNKKTAPK